MASNDSGVDTSNDSNDSNALAPNLFDFLGNNGNQLNAFALPRSLFDSPRQHTLPSASHALKIRPRSKTKTRIKNAFPHVLPKSKERKLRFAASTHNTDMVILLLESGTDPNCYDEHKRSPLHLAACRGYADVVAELLKFGANPNIIDSLGNTPLHLAVISASSNNFNWVVRILLQGGASVHILDRGGKNPLELAKSKLRLMRCRYKNPSPETSKILEDMCRLIALILRHFCKQKRDIDELAALEERLQNLSTEDQVASEADTLLDSVERLSITK